MRSRALIGALPLATLLLAATLLPASAEDLVDQQSDIEDKIAATEDALAEASDRLKAAAADLSRVQGQLPAARQAVDSATGRLRSERDRLSLIRQQLRKLQAEQAIIQDEINSAQVTIDRSETLIGRIVRYQYQSGGYAELQVVLEAESPTEFVQRLMATQSVTQSQTEVIDQLNAQQAVLAAREQQMEVTQQAVSAAKEEVQLRVERMQDLVDAARSAAEKLEDLEALRSRALQVAREEKATEMERLQQLEAAQQTLQAQIAAAVSTGSGKSTGPLSWPLPGTSAGQGVGWRTHPVYGYRSCHTGVDIGSPSGTPILAAAAGVVVWTRSELSGPWGNNTLIDHGKGLSTFYPHQSTFNVTPGQQVKQGDVIGYVGTTGYVTGPHLHFEVHINGVPYDPMGWFGGSKSSQSQFCP
jgi:murein DD-endopeptidase MepM/ murein hydrolase activator NlpD